MITVGWPLCVTAGPLKVGGGKAGHSQGLQETGVNLLNILPFASCSPGHFGLFGGQFMWDRTVYLGQDLAQCLSCA